MQGEAKSFSTFLAQLWAIILRTNIQKHQKGIDDMRTANIFKIIGLTLTGLTVIFMLFTGVGNALHAGWTGTAMVIVIVLLLGWLSWKQPIFGGLIICLMAVVLAMYFFLMPNSYAEEISPLLMICVPLGIGGLILIEADWKAKKAKGK